MASSSIAFSILLIGLDGSGKTTIMHSAKYQQVNKEFIILPTSGFQIFDIFLPKQNKPIIVYDCSGEGRHRPMWKTFYSEIDAIIYVIDATDVKRLNIVKDHVDDLFQNEYIEEKNIPIVFMLNKYDSENATDRDDINLIIGFDRYKRISKKKWFIKETSGYNGTGILESLDWLNDTIGKK